MIYTVTFNPSLDYIVDVPGFAPGRTNRTARERIFPGGKGVNVSIVLGHLGKRSTALGFLAGFTGEEIDRLLARMGVATDFIRLQSGASRINMKLRNIEGTEINGMGPAIPPEKIGALTAQLDRLGAGDVLVLAGSVPASMPASIYRDILARLSPRGVRCTVDATGDLLRQTLAYRPFLIKPNHHELGELFGVRLDTREAVIPYAKRLQELGAQNVLVSMAGQGAVLAAQDGRVLSARAPQGTLVNAVGAGDSMVAGFLAGWLDTGSAQEALRMGLAAGSASAFSEGLAAREAILDVYTRVQLDA